MREARSPTWTSRRGIATGTSVEELARGSGLTEVDVARRAVAMADAAPPADEVDPSVAARRRDPGYYLISDGHAALERDVERSRAVGRPAAARLRPRRRPRLPRRRSRSSRRSSSPCPCCCPGPRACRPGSSCRAPRARPGVRPRDRPRQPGGHHRRWARGRCPGSSSTMASRPRCGRSSSCRRSSPPRPTSKRRSAASRSTTSANRDGDVRFALLSDWLDAPTEQVQRRRRAPRGGGRRHRSAQRAPRRGPRRRRPVPAVPPEADAGTRPRAAGWAGSASAASSTS